MNTYGLIRLVAKPELRKTDAGVSVASFVGVFNEQRKVDGKIVEDAHFLDFIIWDKAAEYVCEKFDKGDLIYIASATPRVRNWTDNDGNKRNKVVFRINNFQKVSSPKKNTPVAETVEG